jgi:SAM-dependent methyltransferase
LDEPPASETQAPCRGDRDRLHTYERWTGDLLAAVKGIGLFGNRLLDVGCGEGLGVLAQLERGFEVTGVEISPSRLARARESVGGRATLIEADLRRLPKLGWFDLVWSVDEAINHLLGRVDLEATLRGMRRNLAAGGVVVVCANTLAGYKGSWSRVAEQVQTQEIRPGAIIEAGLDADSPLQRHFPEAELTAAIVAAGLQPVRVLGATDGTLSDPLDEARHTRSVYICTAAG